jgi:hypothetical protein
MAELIYGVNPPEKVNFSIFLLLSLAVSLYLHYFIMLQTLKLHSKTWKTKKKQRLIGLTLVVIMFND